MKRPILIAGNWKMNKTPSQTKAFMQELVEKVGNPTCQVVVFPSYLSLPMAVEMGKNSPIALGAQNCHSQPSGAFTGEVSPEMLQDLGVSYVLVGHSERRTLFGDTNETVNARCRGALQAGIRVILCVGESLAQREQGETQAHLEQQLTEGLQGISGEEMARVAIAYEPIWAIGTGKTATSTQAQETCCQVRGILRNLYGAEIAEKIQILYGGSMNETNGGALLGQPDIDGGLIGGASLQGDAFVALVAEGNKQQG